MDDLTVDIEAAIRMFPIEQARATELLPVDGERVFSLRNLAIVEQLRREATAEIDLGPTVPVDLFLWARNDPPRRDITKIGGVPYRPAGLPWPVLEDGTPYTFLAQLRFTESRDIVGELPGDILLVFVDDEEFCCGNIERPVVFEWYRLGIDDLIAPVDVPQGRWKLPAIYGVRYRTVDFVAFEAEDRIKRVFQRKFGQEKYFRTDNIARFEGTKIGGMPHWISRRTDADVPGRIIFSLKVGGPDTDVPYPWIDVPEPLWYQIDRVEDKELLDKHYADFADAGTLYGFLTAKRELVWEVESY